MLPGLIFAMFTTIKCLLLLLLSWHLATLTHEESLKSQCEKCQNRTGTNSSEVDIFCQHHNDTKTLTLSGDCCVNGTGDDSVILGLDWRDCNITSLGDSLTSLVEIQILCLEGNPDLHIKNDDFSGINHLQYLSLPPSEPCPGNNVSWKSVDHTHVNTVCHKELNLCLVHNISCPSNHSHCAMQGPGTPECLCDVGYYGYRCLRKGDFSTVAFTIGLCCSTVVVAAFLWLTQRRKVKTH